MAKPQSGNIFYNRTTDRPRVALRVGERDLLTTDDGSSPTGVAGGDLGGTYPNPTVEALGTSGTAVNVGAAAPPSAGQTLVATDATHATWQTVSGAPSGAAGGDLGGTYPNPTVEALGTTGTAVNVGAAAPGTVGQVLTLTDATHATWQDGVQNLLNEYWCRDSTISYGAKTDEFTAAALSGSWAIKEWSTWNAVTNGGVVDSTSPPSASNYKITPNARRSWLMLQPAPSGTGVDLAMRQSFTYNGVTGFQFRTRFTPPVFGDASSGANSLNGLSRFHFMKDNAGNPDVGNYVAGGWTAPTGTPTMRFLNQVGGGASGLGTVDYTADRTQDGEFIFVGTGNVGTLTIDVWFRSPVQTRKVYSGSIGVSNGNTVWLVWRMTCTSNSNPNIYAMDYFREYPDLKITP